MVKKGTETGPIATNSLYNTPIPEEGFTRNAGGAPKEAQEAAIKEIIRDGRTLEATPEQIAYALAIARYESGFNMYAAAKSTSTYGLGQFNNKTGKEYGLTADNRNDLGMQAQAVKEHTINNFDTAKKKGYDNSYIYALHHDGPSLSKWFISLKNTSCLLLLITKNYWRHINDFRWTYTWTIFNQNTQECFLYERPPESTDPNEAVLYHMQRLSDPERLDNLLYTLEYGLPIKHATQAALTGAVGRGIHSIDISLIIAPVIHSFIKTTAEEAGIDYKEDFGDSSISEEVERKKAVALLKRSIKETPEEEMDAGTDMLESFVGETTRDMSLEDIPSNIQEEVSDVAEAIKEKPRGLMSKE